MLPHPGAEDTDCSIGVERRDFPRQAETPQITTDRFGETVAFFEAGPSTGAADNRRDTWTSIEATTSPTRRRRCEAKTRQSAMATRVLRLVPFNCSLCFSGEQHPRDQKPPDILWGKGPVDEAGSPGA